MAAQIGLQSGTSTFNYPLELPSGPGGFKPVLELNYNSGSVDGMKNKQSVGSWVGIGWSFTLGSISYDSDSDKYSLNFCQGSYDLYTTDDINYLTKPDQYYKITRSGNTWTLLDTGGNIYRFGGTTDSQQYLYDDYDEEREYYRWDLSLIEDTNGNQATMSYVQEIRGTSPEDWVRSAYPEYINYGEVEIHLTSTWDENDATDGHLRYDNPKTSGSNPAPKVMDNRHLDSVEISVNSNLIRKYEFSYDTTNRVSSGDYDGIYYAGKFTLTSITEIGADGTSELPAMTFSYDDKQIYRTTTLDQYTGNPGNPASLYWPYLTQVNSGYGGSVSFDYTQVGPGYNWSREVVTTKTIDSGIGTVQTYYYTYVGNPQYLGGGWNQKYRGFEEVRETDSQGNYTKHFFYTTGEVNGNDSEKLTGREYSTQYYDSSDNLLKEESYDWTWTITDNTTPGTYISQLHTNPNIIDISITSTNKYYYLLALTNVNNIHGNGYSWTVPRTPQCMAVSSDDYVYAVTMGDYWRSYIYKYTYTGEQTRVWDIGAMIPTGIAISPDNYIYVSDGSLFDYAIHKYNSSGSEVSTWELGYLPTHIAVSPDNYIYVTTIDYYICKYDSSGNFITSWQTDAYPTGIAASYDNLIYVTTMAATSNVKVYSSTGTFLDSWTCANAIDIAISEDDYAYIATSDNYIKKYAVNENGLHNPTCPDRNNCRR